MVSFSKSVVTVLAGALSCMMGTQAAMYWPVTTPSATSPWVIGQPAAIVWTTGGGTGVMAFDIQLHNANRTIMEGFVKIAAQVPLVKEKSGSNKGRYGGQLGIDLTDTSIPTGDGFILVFMNTGSGAVYSRSPKFSILPASQQPDNFTTATLPAGPADRTVTLTQTPNPTQAYATTLDGQYSIAAVTSIAGGAGH